MWIKNFIIVAVFGLAFILFIVGIVRDDPSVLDHTIQLMLFGYILIAWRDIEKLQERLTSIEKQPRVDADDMAKRIATKIRELLRST